ncbi:hypothetical protein C0995_013636 [Termitomyces sp. Mi166|nr:hypothetical protein C0995_013636 [Termitomyces sp. Mi166\
MKRQCITMLEHIEHAGKRKAPAYKELMVEPKQARAPARQPQEFVQAPAPTAVQPPSLSATLISVRSDSVLPWSSQEPNIPAIVENPLAEVSLEPCNKIMNDAGAMQQEQRVEAPHMPVMSSQAGLSSQGEACLAPEIPELKAQPAAVESRRLFTSSYALDVLGPTKHCRGQKPPLDVFKLDIVDFPDNVPAQAGPAQLLFMCTVLILAPPPQFTVVVLTTDSRTPEQYNGLVVTQQKTAATSKGKGKVVAMVDNESDYGQSLSEDKQESEERVGCTALSARATKQETCLEEGKCSKG